MNFLYTKWKLSDCRTLFSGLKLCKAKTGKLWPQTCFTDALFCVPQMVQVRQHTQRGSFKLFHNQGWCIEEGEHFCSMTSHFKPGLKLFQCCYKKANLFFAPYLDKSGSKLSHRWTGLCQLPIIRLTMVQYLSLHQHSTLRHQPREKADMRRRKRTYCWSTEAMIR